MRIIAIFTVLALTLLTVSVAAAQVFKCPRPGGGIQYADRPCGGGAAMGDTQIRANTLDTSAQREAIRQDQERMDEAREQQEHQRKVRAHRDAQAQFNKADALDAKRQRRQFDVPAAGIPIAGALPPGPTSMSSCDKGGCWANDGTRFNSAGSTLFGTNGKICHKTGPTIHCN